MYSNKFIDIEVPISAKEIDYIEHKYKFRFPDEIRYHYLKYNGGRPVRYTFGDCCELQGFLPIKHAPRICMTFEEAFERLKIESPVLPDYLVPLATDFFGNYYCFSIKPDELGAIYFWEHEFYEDPKRAITFLIGSLREFIEKLVHEPDDE